MKALCVLTTAVLGCGWLLFLTTTLRSQTTRSQTAPETTGYDALAQSLVERARDEVAQVKALVDQGTLPKTRLVDAQNHLADAQDQLVLARTLYSQIRLQDMTTEQANAMVAAAQRRVDRQDKILQGKRGLVEGGILANSELVEFEDELESRRRVLGLATDRVKLLEELKEMAEAERQLEHAALTAKGANLAGVMIRYEGSGSFNLRELPTISDQFQRKFHRPLPVSALGETRVHEAMGLDHRNRVDVALNPDGTEGVWLRQLLERLRIPYLAFRSAVVGAATAPHIHIGTGSTRLTLAQP